MKFFLLILFLLFGYYFYCQKPPKKYHLLIKKADSLYNIKEYKNSAFTFDSAFKSFENKGFSPDRYNAARSWALANYTDSAFLNLEKIANKLYFSDYEITLTEKAFNTLHKDKRWNILLQKINLNNYLFAYYWQKHEK